MTKFKLNCMLNSETATYVADNFDLSQFNNPSYTILPGFIDVHVHLREPGFCYKETIETGTKASARGGYTAVCSMPNLNPVPDSPANLQQQLDAIQSSAVINVYPYGAITVGQKGERLADLEGMTQAFAFSDDGRGVQSDEMMLKAMQIAKSLGKVIVAHCEVNDLLKGGYIHDGSYAKAHGHKGICSASEYQQVARDLKLVEQTGVSYHVCHVSTKESVDLIRQAKAKGLDVTCETAPHYLVMCQDDLQEDGKFKMNPPLRDAADRDALIQGVLDGTIDVIATDHAPHSAEEKSRGLAGSAFGIVGIETAFSVMYTHFVKTGVMTMQKLLDLLVYNARKRFNLPLGVDFSIWKLDEQFVVNPNDFLSKGKATPFENATLSAVNYLTVANGKVAYKKEI